MDTTQKLLTLVMDSGAHKAAALEQSGIITDAGFRKSCEMNTCGAFKRNWHCPPAIGPIDELMERVKKYQRGVLYQTVFEIEDSFDIEGMRRAGKLHGELSRRVHRQLLEGAAGESFLHLANGGCKICPVCAIIENRPCRYPKEALSPMEGYGIDVYNTAKNAGLKYINGQNTVTSFSLILF